MRGRILTRIKGSKAKIYKMSSRGMLTLSPLCIWLFLTLLQNVGPVEAKRNGEINIDLYRQRVKRMFYHAYDGYLTHAYPYDELQPLTCNGHDTWGSYSLTLIDAMDTLVVMGNYSEFRRIAQILIDKGESFFDIDINVSVFETNIRIVGGLLSAHLMMKRAGMVLEPAWPCSGPLLRMADNIARKILPAFDTPTGMPYGTVNLRHGVPKGETTVTCTAGVGTFIIEFGALSRLTGDPIFEKTAIRAMRALWKFRSPLGLLGNHIDVSTGKWTALDSGIGGGIDSYFEYLVKGAVMFNIPELVHMFRDYEVSINKYLKRDDWYMWAQMAKGTVTLPLFTSLDGYWPSIKSMLGDIDEAMKTMHNFHQVWRQFGFTPEYYNIPKADVHQGREGYPLRPEIVESAMYLYRATKDPYLLEIGVDIVEAIEHSARTSCGYATVKDVRDHRLEDRMESFFLAETTKYLYLLFDPENFIHNNGSHGSVISTPSGKCIIEAGGYIFNTEAHPLDLAAVHCCSAAKKEEDRILQEFHDNLDLLSLLDLVENDDVDWILGEKKWKRKKKIKQNQETKDLSKDDAKEDVDSVPEQLKFGDDVNDMPPVNDEEDIFGDDYDDEDDLDEEDKEFFAWAEKDAEADFDQSIKSAASPVHEKKKKTRLHVVDMASFTEMERNITHILMEELQMDFIMKNVSAHIAEKLKQQYKETEHEDIANDVARKLLEARLESVMESNDTLTPTSDDGGTRETGNKVPESAGEKNINGQDEKLENETDSENDEINSGVKVESTGVKADKLEKENNKDVLEPVIRVTVTSKDDAQNNQQEVTAEKGQQVVIVHLNKDENENFDSNENISSPPLSSSTSSSSSSSEEEEEEADSEFYQNENTEAEKSILSTEGFRSHLELQIQNQDDQQKEQIKDSTIQTSKISTSATPSPLESKRNNFMSITTKILKIFTGGSSEESKEEVPQGRTPSLEGLYLSLAKYPLKYFHDPEIMHCPAQSFHSRISVYGEMFPDEL